jgi:hypothetical protein
MQVEAELALRPNLPGARRLRRVIAGDVHVTLSAIERRFVELMRAERRVLPVTNRPLAAAGWTAAGRSSG